MTQSSSHDSASHDSASRQLETLSPQERLLALRSMPKSRSRLYQHKSGFAFAPSYGLTAVLPLTLHWVALFAVPLYDALSMNKEIHDAMLLLPPDSYHMTLRGLTRDLLPSVEIQTLKALDDAYLRIFEGSRAQIHVKPEHPYATGIALLVLEPHDALHNLLAAAQSATCTVADLEPAEQEYHLSIGYFITQDRAAQVRAQDIVLHTVKQILSAHRQRDGSFPLLELLPPRVCWYDSMKRFPLMFPEVVPAPPN